MHGQRVFDLDREVLDLLKREETLAFVDVELDLPSGGRTSGVLKLSKPREGKARSTYLAVFFLLDTPGEALRAEVEAWARRAAWDRLQSDLAGCRSVFPIPYASVSRELYLLEADVYVSLPAADVHGYLTGSFVPALCRATGLRAGEVLFWEEREEPREAASAAPAGRGSGGMLEQLRRLLSGGK